MIVLRLLIVLINMLLMIGLYRRCAGTLSIKKINLNSLVFYYLFGFCFIGASLVFCGFRAHYLLKKCSNETLERTYWVIMYVIIALPIGMKLFARMIGIRDFGQFFSDYSENTILDIEKNENTVFTIVFILSLIGAAALAYTLRIIGYIPLFQLFRGSSNYAAQRQLITRNFVGNTYIRNLFALTLIPALSYIAYIYYRLTKQLRWLLLFFVLFIMASLCKTYNFEKAPIIFYIAYFYIIETMLNRVQSIGKAVKYGIVVIALILLAYELVAGTIGDLNSLSSGPLARLLITQIATCFLHFQAFPVSHAFLNGASFPRAVSWLFGASESGLRSGRLVMEIYNASGVNQGIAGVMNSLFVAEAYANFNMSGAILSPWVVSFVITVIPCWILKQKKTPLMISLYVIVSSSYAGALTGGYVDFIYNISIVFIIVVIAGIQAIADGGKLTIRF